MLVSVQSKLGVNTMKVGYFYLAVFPVVAFFYAWSRDDVERQANFRSYVAMGLT